ncbi:MAG TPA: hypothetical protein VGQ36_25305 [Thermoanaerobaculia bacterium]|jgi:hypothetical protein|nr:hypothetical protein [Thermoanaerobaculia bacterium]
MNELKEMAMRDLAARTSSADTAPTPQRPSPVQPFRGTCVIPEAGGVVPHLLTTPTSEKAP